MRRAIVALALCLAALSTSAGSIEIITPGSGFSEVAADAAYVRQDGTSGPPDMTGAMSIIPDASGTPLTVTSVTDDTAATAVFNSGAGDAVQSAGPLRMVQTLGPEETTNTVAAWNTLGAGWSVSDTPIVVTLTATGGISTAASQSTATVVAGTTYRLDFTYTRTAGTLTPSVGGVTGTAVSAAGPVAVTQVIGATATTALAFTGAGFTGTVYSISLKPITSTIDSDVGPVVIESSGDIRFFPASGFSTYVYSPLLLPDGTAAAPSLGWASDADGSGTGYYRSGANVLAFSANGVAQWFTSTDSFRFKSSLELQWSSGDAISGSRDTMLYRVSNGILGLKGAGTSAAELRIDGDGTASDTKYLSLKHDGTFSVITTDGGQLRLGLGATNYLYLATTTLGPVTSGALDLGAAGQLYRSAFLSSSLQGGGSKALTDNVATGFVKIAVAQTASVAFDIRFTVKAADATDMQVEKGRVSFTCVNKAGTVTCATPVVYGNTVPLVTAGTLAATTFAISEVDADTVTVTATSDTSLTTTSHVIQYFTECESACTVTQNP